MLAGVNVRLADLLVRARCYGRRIQHARKSMTLEPAPQTNSRFARFAKSRTITLKTTPIFLPSDVFFTMGSCFAEEIRSALTQRDIICVPDYAKIRFDSLAATLDDLPRANHLNFYNTFTVKQQLEQLLGLWEQEPDDFWTLNRISPDRPVPWTPPIYQDPYRRLVQAITPEILQAVLRSINAEMRVGFDAATAFIFTFGMTEVFINKQSGKVAAQKPLYGGAGGEKETTLHISSFEENLTNVRAIVDLIQERKPAAKIIVSVSPVPLARTFQDQDVVTVSMEGKSILRAALGQICRERNNVFYLPSYEFVTSLGYNDGYREDMRHVQKSVIAQIVDAFFQAFFISETP